MQDIMVISGASGFIGGRLAQHFENLGWEVRKVGRKELQATVSSLAAILEGARVVVNLAGTPIIKRWTKRNRHLMRQSRVDTTLALVKAMELIDKRPEVFINASAIGIYPGSGIHGENSGSRAQDFLGQLCVDWEDAAMQAPKEIRQVLLRLGVVLDTHQGALHRLLPIFRMGLGGRLGNGRQAFSWIHINDLLRAVEFIISKHEIAGAVNMTAPGVVDNKTFTQMLARVLHRPAILPVPAFALHLAFGSGSAALLKGQHAVPAVLQKNGFVFKYPEIESALQALLRQKQV